MVSFKSVLNLIVCGALVVALSGASGCDKDKDDKVEITILHTNDIHSHFLPEQSTSEKNPFNLGGLARLKTLVSKLRAQKKNTLLLDAGDWSEGNIFYTVDAGATMLKVMDKIGYDATVVGNHDFLNGPLNLAKRIEMGNPSFPVLGANKNLDKLAGDDKARVEKAVGDYVIREVGGVKVAIIGILCDDALYYPYFKPAIVTSPFDTASAITKHLHDNKLADVIVLLSHNSFKKQVVWAKQIPYVNVIISGHSHFKTPKPFETTNGGQPAYIAETKEWAQFLGDMTLVVDRKKHTVTMKNYELHPVSADNLEDAGVADMIADAGRALTAKYGRDVLHDHVGDCEDEMLDDHDKEGPLGNLIVDAFRAAADTDVAMESNLLVSVSLTPGPLRSYDVMNVIPHIYSPLPDGSPFPEFGSSWTVKKLSMRGQDLRALYNVAFLTNSVGIPLGWISSSGVQVTYSRSGGASPVQSLKVMNKTTGVYEPVRDDQRYTVALQDGLLLALSEIIGRLHLSIDLSQITETRIPGWQMLLAWVEAKQTIRAADYEAGSRFHATEFDLGFYNHNVKLERRASGYVLRVTVQNEGLTASPAGVVVSARRSEANDAVWDRSGNEKTAVGPDATLPALNPGERAVAEIPWAGTPAPGVYSVGVGVSTTDGNPENNSLQAHFRIQ